MTDKTKLENAKIFLEQKCCLSFFCTECAARVDGDCLAKSDDRCLPTRERYNENAIPFFEEYVARHSPKANIEQLLKDHREIVERVDEDTPFPRADYHVVSGHSIEVPMPEKKLRLEEDWDGDLSIYYGENHIGWINIDGECWDFEDEDARQTLQEWRDAGMPTDPSGVEWRGGRYKLGSWGYLKRTDITWGTIYGFEKSETFPGCEDPNVVRDDEGRAVMYGETD